MSEIAHEFESLLGAVRTGRVVVDNDVLDTCESAAIALFESLHLASSGVIEPSRRALFERIQVLAQGNSAKAGPDIGSVLDDLPFEIWQSLTGDEKDRLEQAVEEGDDPYVITTSFDIASFDEEFSSLKEKLAARGEVIATSPMVDLTNLNFELQVALNQIKVLRSQLRQAQSILGCIVCQLVTRSNANATRNGAPSS